VRNVTRINGAGAAWRQHYPSSIKSGQAAQSDRPGHTGQLLELAEEIEGGSAHGVLYGIAEIAEGQQ
jgi:hypothetical protein